MGLELTDVPIISKNDLKQVQIVGTHLHEWIGKGTVGLNTCIQRMGCVQIDPINPAGRNHDHFFLSRIPNYRQGSLESDLYQKAKVFEAYFPNLHAIDRRVFPLFYSSRKEHLLGPFYTRNLEKITSIQPSLFTDILDYIDTHGPSSATILDQFSKNAKGAKWKTTGSGANVLEILWATGKLALVKRDENFHKFYDRIENRFSHDELTPKSIPEKEIWYSKLQFLHQSFPFLDAKIQILKDQRLKRSRSKSAWTNRIQSPLESYLSPKSESYSPTLIYCPEIHKILLIRSDWKDLLKPKYDTHMRAIAPLDPLIYDRKLLHLLFDFEYTWEIYKPKNQRRWGYYVYPLLYNGQFIGRLEAKKGKKASILKFFNLQLESQVTWNTHYQKALQNLLDRWKTMVNATEISLDASISTILN